MRASGTWRSDEAYPPAGNSGRGGAVTRYMTEKAERVFVIVMGLGIAVIELSTLGPVVTALTFIAVILFQILLILLKRFENPR
jgi:hypothetical protein